MIKSGIITDSGTPSASDMRGFATLYLTSTYDGTTTITTGKLTKSRTRILGTANWLEENFTYDSYGRVGSTSGNNHLDLVVGSETVTNTYDFADNLLTTERTSQTPWKTITVRDRFTYDHAGRTLDTYQRIDSGVEKLLSHQYYTDKDELREKNIGFAGFSGWLQSVDYSYNAQGWLTGINAAGLSGTQTALPLCSGAPSPGSPGGSPDANDLFSLELQYDQLYTGTAGTVKKNGNISQAVWQVRGRERMGYNFQYDFLNRMTRANSFDIAGSGSVSYTNRFYERVDYADYRGNISQIYRRGLYKTSGGASCFSTGYTDRLTFQYTSGTNRLNTVTEATTGAAAAYGFDPGTGSGSYTYDDNGNLTHDPYKDLDIDYNHLNLPETMDFPGTDEITVVYDAAGNKLSQTILDGGVSITRDYLGNLEYVDGTLESIHHSEGRVVSTNGNNTSTGLRYEYFLKDHLGNVRTVFADLNGNDKIDQTTNPATNEVLQENHHYPFGLKYDGNWAATSLGVDNRYQYNGIEHVEDLGLNWDMAFYRSYDPAIGRWLQIDPQAESFATMSPYTGMGNNPVLISDPLGDSINVSQIMESHPDIWRTAKADLEEITGLSLSVDDSGNLTYETPEGKLSGSKKARKKLIKAIGHEETVTVKGCEDCASAVTSMNPDASISTQNEFTLSRDQIQNFIDGTSDDLDNQTYGFGMNFLHELGHTRVGGRMFDTQHLDGNSLGKNVKSMNKIRSQLGPRYGKRVKYNPMNADPSAPEVYYAFGRSSFKSLKKGKVPTSQFIIIPRN